MGSTTIETTIRAGTPPAYLYKYRSLSGTGLKYAEASILRAEFFFSRAAEFNDPFDCLPVFSLDASTEELKTHFARLLGDDPDRERKIANFEARCSHPEVFSRAFEDMRQTLCKEFTHDVGILSLSAIPDDILMWSHYADCHRGVVLRLSRTRSPSLFSVMQPVAYCDERPVVHLIHDDDETKLDKSLLTKSRHWAYEQEWRMLTPNRGTPNTGPGAHTVPPDALDAVILGAKISKQDENSIRQAVSARLHPTTVFRAHIDDKLFKIRIESA